MKFYINGKYHVAQLTGVQRVAKELSGRLPQSFSRYGVSCAVITPPSWMRIGKLRPIWTTLWEQFILPIKAHDGFLLNLCNTAPILFQNNQLVLIHDAAVYDVPENFTWIYVFWAKLQMKLLVLGSSRIATVSQFSRKRLSAVLGLSFNNTLIVKEGCNHALEVSSSDDLVDRLKLRERQYILTVGSLQSGKNLVNLLQAVKLIKNDIIIVIVGGGNSLVFSPKINLPEDRCIQTGYVSEGELRSLYKYAACFVQASTYEGFGLPPLEAMALGTPVVCSRAASLPEICGDAAFYFDPYSPDDIARSINAVIGDLGLRQRLIKAGWARAQFYNWDDSAQELVDNLLKIYN